MKQKKNPFFINSVEYLDFIWPLHFLKLQFNAAQPQHRFVYTQWELSALWRTQEALNQLFCFKEVSYLQGKKKSIILIFEETKLMSSIWKKNLKIIFHTNQLYF